MEKINAKIIVITGSSRGFGYAIAEAMLEAGAIVTITGRSEAAIDASVDQLKSKGSVNGLICDVTDEMQVNELAESVVSEHGRIDIWINNAGYSTAAGVMLDMDPSDALDMFKTNALGTLYGTRAAMKHMKGGYLVNIYGAGSNGKASSPTGLYAASKAWVTSFTRTLAKETSGSDVHIVGFNPGMMLTDMLTKPVVVGEEGKAMMKNYAFVLRFLARQPRKSAQELVELISRTRKPFTEYRVIKPWTPFAGLLRVAWENITKTGKTPEFELQYKDTYKG